MNAKLVELKSVAPTSNVELEAVKAKLRQTGKTFEEFKCFMEMRSQTNDKMIVQVWNNHQQLITDSCLQYQKLEVDFKDLKAGQRTEQMVLATEKRADGSPAAARHSRWNQLRSFIIKLSYLLCLECLLISNFR